VSVDNKDRFHATHKALDAKAGGWERKGIQGMISESQLLGQSSELNLPLKAFVRVGIRKQMKFPYV
jgi:hypothetical protein